ncbi:hypothetical protein WMF01_12070 [Sorangium sp. So ce1667]
MHIVFDDLTEATTLIAAINVLLGYPKPNVDMGTGQIVGYTETWAEAQKHPALDLWAVPYKPEIDPVIGDLEPQELDPSWNPADIGIPPG